MISGAVSVLFGAAVAWSLKVLGGFSGYSALRF